MVFYKYGSEKYNNSHFTGMKYKQIATKKIIISVMDKRVGINLHDLLNVLSKITSINIW